MLVSFIVVVNSGNMDLLTNELPKVNWLKR